MKSTLITAAVIAISAFASFNAFADGGDEPFKNIKSAPSPVTRAEVRADAVKAKKAGQRSTIDNSFPGNTNTVAGKGKTRGEVRAELKAAGGADKGSDSKTYAH
jgi:hypothetical protein